MPKSLKRNYKKSQRRNYKKNTFKKSLKRKSLKRNSLKRKSLKRNSLKRNSLKRKSLKRKTYRKKNMKRKSLRGGMGPAAGLASSVYNRAAQDMALPGVGPRAVDKPPEQVEREYEGSWPPVSASATTAPLNHIPMQRVHGKSGVVITDNINSSTWQNQHT
jgi:hypothetical protein